jgi:hypothetical protein
MSLLSRLFAKPAPKTPDPILHKSCRIFAQPIKEGSTYRIAARIEKEFDGHLRTHLLIRADTCTSEEEAVTTSVSKAKQAIDQLGDAIFG